MDHRAGPSSNRYLKDEFLDVDSSLRTLCMRLSLLYSPEESVFLLRQSSKLSDEQIYRFSEEGRRCCKCSKVSSHHTTGMPRGPCGYRPARQQ